MARYCRSVSYGVLAVGLALTVCVWPAAAEEGSPAEIPEDLADLDLAELMEIDVVVSASRYEQPVMEAPAKVTVVTGDEIRAYGYRTLGDVLNSVGGVYTTYDRNYDYAGSRGFGPPGDNNSRLLILLDGVRTNDSVFGASAIGGDFPLDLDLIDRVEYVHGPGSSIYGSNAFLGVVNIVTRTGGGIDGVRLSGEAASYGTYGGRITYGSARESGLEILFSGSLAGSDGQDIFFAEFDDPDTNNGLAAGGDEHDFGHFFTKVSYGAFSLLAAYGSREKGIPTASYETEFNDPRNRTEDRTGFLALEHRSEIGERTRITSRLNYNLYEFDGDYVYDYGDPGDPYILVNQDLARSVWWGGEFLIDTRPGGNQHLIAGAEYRNESRMDQSNYDEEVYLDSRESSTSWAVFLQDEVSLGEKVLLNVGVRHDDYGTFGGSTNPRAALIYRPTGRTAFKLLYGTAFRAPNAYELYYGDGGDTQKANPDLGPEEIDTFELVAERQISRAIRATLSWFDYEIDDLITMDVDPDDDLLVFDNVDRVEGSGAELELQGRWINGVQGRLSYAYQESRDVLADETLENSPERLVKLNLRAPLYRRLLFAGLETHYTGSRRTVQDTVADDYWLSNLTLSSVIRDGAFEISLSVYNLFDEEYADPVSDAHAQDMIWQNDRNYRLKIYYRF